MRKAVHAVGRAPLGCDIRGTVVIVVLAAEAPGGHGPCGDSSIRGAQLNSPTLRLLGVSHCAERPAHSARARSPAGLLYSHMLTPKQSQSWHVLRSKAHVTFPLALPSVLCPCFKHTQTECRQSLDVNHFMSGKGAALRVVSVTPQAVG